MTKKHDDLAEARRVLEVEAQCILAARDKLDDRFEKAVALVVDAVEHGAKVVVSGIGKSGKVAAKVAATLASTGTPAFFVHAVEAQHGDLGIVGPRDVMIVFSYSGSSDEIVRLIPPLKRRGAKIIAIVGNVKSILAQEADVVLDGSVTQEACPLNLAPTSSTTVALALGDALAMALSVRFDFKEENFLVNHPGGTLGRRLTLLVRDLMKSGADVPWVSETETMDVIVEISSKKRLGAVLVGIPTQKSFGIITDGDIRRALKHKNKFFDLKAKDVMTRNPVSVLAGDKAIRALELMENRSSQISVLPVVNEQELCIGLVRLHDLIGQL